MFIKSKSDFKNCWFQFWLFKTCSAIRRCMKYMMHIFFTDRNYLLYSHPLIILEIFLTYVFFIVIFYAGVFYYVFNVFGVRRHESSARMMCADDAIHSYYVVIVLVYFTCHAFPINFGKKNLAVLTISYSRTPQWRQAISSVSSPRRST